MSGERGEGNARTDIVVLHTEKLEAKCSLTGSGASIMSVQFDYHVCSYCILPLLSSCNSYPQSKLVLAASNDYASRIWSISDQRLKVV